MIYRGYRIEGAPDYTRANYQFEHLQYDGPGDHRHGTGDTIKACMKQIDEIEDEE